MRPFSFMEQLGINLTAKLVRQVPFYPLNKLLVVYIANRSYNNWVLIKNPSLMLQ
jgi:hypothetical protein